MSTHYAKAQRHQVPTLPTMDLDRIDAPGAYIMHSEGLLMRIPPEALCEKGPVWSITASTPLRVSRVSNDPWIAIGKAREIATENHLSANF